MPGSGPIDIDQLANQLARELAALEKLEARFGPPRPPPRLWDLLRYRYAISDWFVRWFTVERRRNHLLARIARLIRALEAARRG